VRLSKKVVDLEKSTEMKQALLFSIFALAFYGCSKEKSFESRLNNEEWNIDKFVQEIYINGQLQQGQTCTGENIGSIKLNKDATGSASWNVCGIGSSFSITKWSVTADSVKLELKDNVTQGIEKRNFSVQKNERKNQEWKQVVVTSSPAGPFEQRYTFTLSRKK
jgi:hypothetical protein